MTTSFLHGAEITQLSDGARTIKVSSSSIIGIVGTAKYADADDFPLDTPVLVTRPSQAASLTATAAGALDVGSLPGALGAIFDIVSTPVVVVRVEQLTTESAQLAEVVGDSATGQGVYALERAQSLLGLRPKILVAPAFTHQEPVVSSAKVVNPVVAALKLVAVKAGMRAIVFTDAPNDTQTIALAKQTREAGERVMSLYPWVYTSASPAAAVPLSARAAAVMALTDQTRGYWWSPSNQVVEGVIGLSRSVTFGLSDPACDANLLNAGNVTTLINQGGFRLWGNQTGSVDPAWTFLSVGRTRDVLYDAFDQAFLWAMDQPFSLQLFRDIIDEGNAFLREQKAKGAILGGRFWLDPELNTEASLKGGEAYYDFDFEPPAPLQTLHLRAARNGKYYSDLVAAVTSSTLQTAA